MQVKVHGLSVLLYHLDTQAMNEKLYFNGRFTWQTEFNRSSNAGLCISQKRGSAESKTICRALFVK
jgi:hypothetical protein